MTVGLCRLSLRSNLLAQQKKQSVSFRPIPPVGGYVSSVGRTYYRTDSRGFTDGVTLRKRPVTHSRSNGTSGLFDGLANLRLRMVGLKEDMVDLYRGLVWLQDQVRFLSDRDHQCGSPTSSRLRNL